MPRYEISKLRILAQIDLEETIRGNQDETDKTYGDADTLGKEIGEEIKKEEQMKRLEFSRQLASNRKTFKDYKMQHEIEGPSANSPSPLDTLSISNIQDKRLLSNFSTGQH